MLSALGIFGASLFFGDSMITPAISVLSAVEGLKIVEPSLEHLIVPITATIIVLLFLFQRLGTATVGRLFGPVMIVWFTAIAVCGINGIADHPEILKALSPTYAIEFFFSHFSIAFFALAAVVLAVTGAEALYADMGHFGRPAITGAFSVAQQAVQPGYLPRLRIAHTSDETIGQIYVPWINSTLMVSVLTLVFAFQTPPRSRSPSARPSPARSRSPPCCSSTSTATSGANRCGWSPGSAAPS